jgi:hypothetical protein
MIAPPSSERDAALERERRAIRAAAPDPASSESKMSLLEVTARQLGTTVAVAIAGTVVLALVIWLVATLR